MRRYTKTKLDSNHRAICDELRSQGLEVIEIMEPVDTVMRFGSFVAFVELKPEGRGTYTRKQLKFLSETRCPAAIVKTARDARVFLQSRNGLTQKQQDAIAVFLLKTKADKWNSEQIDKVLAEV